MSAIELDAKQRESFFRTVIAIHGEEIADKCRRILESEPGLALNVVLAIATSDDSKT